MKQYPIIHKVQFALVARLAPTPKTVGSVTYGFWGNTHTVYFEPADETAFADAVKEFAPMHEKELVRPSVTHVNADPRLALAQIALREWRVWDQVSVDPSFFDGGVYTFSVEQNSSGYVQPRRVRSA